MSFPAPAVAITAPSLLLAFFLARGRTKSLKGVHWLRSVNALGKLTVRPLPVGVAPSVPRALTMDWAPALLASLPESLSDVVPPGVQLRRESSLFRQSEKRNVHCPLTSSASHDGSPSVQTIFGGARYPGAPS